MPDRTGNAADRFDEWLDTEGRFQAGDDLTGFADRILRDAASQGSTSTVPSREQRDRMRARVFGVVPATSKARTPMTTHAFSANGATPAPLPIREPDRPANSGFSMLMTAALIAVIGIAAFGLVRNSFEFTLPGFPGGDDPSSGDLPGLALSPEATPSPGDSCNVSNGIPVVDGRVPAFDDLTSYAVLDDSGTLTLFCGDTTRELATDMRDAIAIGGTATFFLVTDDGQVQLLDVDDGTTLTLESAQLLTDSGEINYEDAVFSGFHTPWLITPVNADRTDWRITDLRSLDSFLLSDELGGPLAVPQEPYVYPFNSSDVAVFTWWDPAFPAPTPAPSSQQLSDQAALVLPGSVEGRRWIDLYDWQKGKGNYLQTPSSQPYSVSPDGSLLAYTTLSDSFEPVIRIEEAADGTHAVDVPIDEINADTRFILAGEEPHLVWSDGESVHYLAFVQGAAREIATRPHPQVIWILPTANSDIVLVSDSSTSVLPVDVTTGDGPGFYQYVPPIYSQVFSGRELPTNIVTVSYESQDSSASIVSLVNPATGEVVLQSDPIDQAPAEIISWSTWLRDGGQLALVQLGPDRALVMNAVTQEIWEIEAPESDDPLWDFYLPRDGSYLVVESRTTNPETLESDAYIAPLEPNPDWQLIDVPTSGQDAAATPAA